MNCRNGNAKKDGWGKKKAMWNTILVNQPREGYFGRNNAASPGSSAFLKGRSFWIQRRPRSVPTFRDASVKKYSSRLFARIESESKSAIVQHNLCANAIQFRSCHDVLGKSLSVLLCLATAKLARLDMQRQAGILTVYCPSPPEGKSLWTLLLDMANVARLDTPRRALGWGLAPCNTDRHRFGMHPFAMGWHVWIRHSVLAGAGRLGVDWP